MKKKYLLLYESIKLVKSKNNYCIYDFQLKKIHYIDIVTAYILTYCYTNTIDEIYNSSKLKRIDFFPKIDDLIQNNIARYCELRPRNYFRNNNQYYDYFGIKVIEIELNEKNLNFLKKFFAIISDKIWIESVLINLNEEFNINSFINYLLNLRIGSVILNNSKNTFSIQTIKKLHGYNKISYILSKEKINEKKYIKKSKYPIIYFNINLYYESKSLNSYYNNRLYIDETGCIKPGKNIKNKFSNIKSINNFSNFKNMYCDKNFMIYKNLKKNDIIECRLCIYRYICIDEREPLKYKDNDKYYFRNKCNLKKII